MGQPTAAITFVSIDVSNNTLDACLITPGGRVRQEQFTNDARGHTALIRWADRPAGDAPLRFCLEASGPYSDPPATALADAGRVVSVANPARVKAHGQALGQANKTDPADARLIAEYARDRNPPASQP